MLNIKRNTKIKKVAEALGATADTDTVLVQEILTNIRETTDSIILNLDGANLDNETISVCYELAEMAGYTIDKIFNKLLKY